MKVSQYACAVRELFGQKGDPIMSFCEILRKHPVLFLGAEMSVSLGYPTAANLAENLAGKLPKKDVRAESLDNTVEKLKGRYGRKETIEILSQYVKGKQTPLEQNPYFLLKKMLDKVGGEFTRARALA